MSYARSVAIDRAAPINNGLVGWWPLCELGGRRANNLLGFGHGIMTNDPSWGGSPIGGSAVFDGSNDYIDVAHNEQHNLDVTLTISVWINPTSGTAYPPVVQKTASATNGWSLEFNFSPPSTQLALWFYSSGWTAMGYTTLTNAIWSHFATVRNGSTEIHYLNGREIQRWSNSLAIAASSANLQIGGNTGLGRYHGGSIAHVRIYRRALAQNEIKRLYSEPWAGTKPVSFINLHLQSFLAAWAAQSNRAGGSTI